MTRSRFGFISVVSASVSAAAARDGWMQCCAGFVNQGVEAATKQPIRYSASAAENWSRSREIMMGEGNKQPLLMFPAIMSGGVGISGRELYKYR